MKILNLYAGIGGNRYKWNEIKNDIKVTAIEIDPECARLYQERFPSDNVIVTDAHDFLIKNYKDYDFIWSSPPCPTHSQIRASQRNRSFFIPKYPDLKLYEEIIFLDNFFSGKYVVENVLPYYPPLIQGKKRGRHLYWSNFNIPNNIKIRKTNGIICEMKQEIKSLSIFHNFDFKKYKGNQRRVKIARNTIDYEVGKNIFESMLGIIKKQNIKQKTIFE